MASVGGWGTHVVVYSNGDAYRTTNYAPAGLLWNSGMLVTSTLNGAPAYGVGSCSLRALIRAPSSCGPPSPPACGSGSHSWYLSAWQGNCNSACSAQGKTCIAQPAASRNANCVLALAVDNGFSCSNNRPGSWSGNPSIATLSGSGSCWYNSGTSSSSTFCSASSPSYHRFCPCT